MPKVSILSASYNHEKYVAEAIGSALNQSYSDFELIVTDDGSTDETVNILRSFSDPRLKVIEHGTNRGMGLAYQTGWNHSQGEYIAWLDTDDVYESHKLEVLTKILDTHPNVLAVFGLSTIIDDDGNSLNKTFPNDAVGKDRYWLLNNLFKLQNYLCSTASMIRRSAFERVGYFNPAISQVADLELWIRMLFQGELLVVPEYILRYRQRAGFANASAQRHDSVTRTNFEMFQTLRLFLENIDSADLLCRIFPEVKEHPWPIEDRLVPFHLAHLALAQGYHGHRAFALDLLYKLMSDQKMADYLYKHCQFDYPDLFYLGGQRPIFGNSSSHDQEPLYTPMPPQHWLERQKHEMQVDCIEGQRKLLVGENKRLYEDNERLNGEKLQLLEELRVVHDENTSLHNQLGEMCKSKAWKLATMFSTLRR